MHDSDPPKIDLWPFDRVRGRGFSSARGRDVPDWPVRGTRCRAFADAETWADVSRSGGFMWAFRARADFSGFPPLSLTWLRSMCGAVDVHIRERPLALGWSGARVAALELKEPCRGHQDLVERFGKYGEHTGDQRRQCL